MTTTRFGSVKELQAELRKGLRITTVEIDPALATAILDANPQNRPTKVGHVRKLARQLKDGHWNPDITGTIAFNPDERLVDGQHRLRAVVLSGVSIVVDILPNVKSTVGLDENSSRSVADHLALQGVEDAPVVAMATRMLFKEFDTDGNPGASNILDYYQANAVFFQECAAKSRGWLSEIHPARQIMRAGELSGVRAIAIRKSAYHPDKVDEFLSLAMFGGTGASDNSPAGRLFQFLASRKEKAVSTGRRVALTLEALNQHITGKQRRIDLLLFRKAKSRRPKAPAQADETADLLPATDDAGHDEPEATA